MTKKVSCVMRIVASGVVIKKEFEAKNAYYYYCKCSLCH